MSMQLGFTGTALKIDTSDLEFGMWLMQQGRAPESPMILFDRKWLMKECSYETGPNSFDRRQAYRGQFLFQRLEEVR